MSRQPWEWNLHDLERLVRDDVAEDSYIEYKSARALDVTEKVKNEISKDVSAFANAGGGTLIYGIEEEDHRPTDLDGVRESRVDREWLEQVILSRIHPRLDGVRIRAVRLRGEEQVAFVVWIPQSERGPHQASDKKFYTRRNFSVQPMEEYEIRDVYQRRRAPDVVLDFFFRRHQARIDRFPVSWVNPETLHQVELNAEIRNEGGGAVGHALVTLVVDARIVSAEATSGFVARDLVLGTQGKRASVRYLQLPWRAPAGLTLFKSVVFRLLERDLPIRFKKAWVEARNAPFIRWDVRAPDMMPRYGFLELRRDRGDLVLVPRAPPVWGDLLQDDRQRPFLA